MAKFEGMGRSSFLDGLVEKTGLNGYELYDYLNELIDKADSNKPKIEEDEECDYGPIQGPIELRCSWDEAREMITDPTRYKWFGGSSPTFAACLLAADLRTEKLTWIRPVRIRMKDCEKMGEETVVAYWSPKEKKYTFDW